MPTPSNSDPGPWNGWEGSFAINLNRWLALGTDFAGHYSSVHPAIAQRPTIPGNPAILPPIHPPSISNNRHTFLAGPQFAYRMRHGKVFARGLIGGVLAHSHFPGYSLSVPGVLPNPLINIPAFSLTNHALAWDLGGGGDLMFTRSFGWRVAQVDYLA